MAAVACAAILVASCLVAPARAIEAGSVRPVRSVALPRGRLLACSTNGADAARGPKAELAPPRVAAEPAVDVARLGVLLTVPVAWGTYAPAVKIAYGVASDPPIPGIVLSAGQYLVALLSLSLAAALAGPRATPQGVADASRSVAPSAHAVPARTPRGTWPAAFELGGYLFVANMLQIVGLSRVPTNRAAFLVQTTTLLVPLIDAAQRGGLGRLPARTWIACLLAFGGVVTMSGGSAAAAVGSRAALPAAGEALILGAALIYSWHVIRLSALAPALEPLRLAPCKAACELLLAVTLISVLLLAPALPSAPELRAFGAELAALSAHDRALLAGAAAWLGAVTTGYTMWAQSYGQGGGVSAPVASLIYTSQPLWSAAFAFALLGEGMEPHEAAGGGLIVAALALGATAPAARPAGAADGAAHADARALRADADRPAEVLGDGGGGKSG